MERESERNSQTEMVPACPIVRFDGEKREREPNLLPVYTPGPERMKHNGSFSVIYWVSTLVSLSLSDPEQLFRNLQTLSWRHVTNRS